MSDWSPLESLNGVASPMLNLLYELALRFYKNIKDHGCDLLKLLIAVSNFYFRTQEFTSWSSLVVGFVDLLNTIFSFSSVPKMLALITRTVKTYFDRLRSSFMVAESAESTVKSFWKFLECKDKRSFVNILWDMSSIFAVVSYAGEFFASLNSVDNLSSVIEVINKHLINKSSDLRVSLTSATECIAKIYDFLVYNQEHFLTGNFSEISWSLPLAVRVENEFADYMALYRRVVDDSSYLEKENITWLQLRSQAQRIRVKLDQQIRASEKGALHSAYVRYLRDIDASMDYLQHRIDPENTKVEPLSVVFCGTPGCGKSEFATTCAKIMQTAVGREPNPSLHATVGGDPKFAVNINNDSEVIIFDDFGNDTGRKISPKEVLDCVNITREPIPKAGVDEKNKHRYSNIGTIFTTNDDQVGLGNISTTSKDSMVRRFGFRVTVGIKDEYKRPGTDNLDRHHPDVLGGFNPEVYDLKVENLSHVGDDGRIVAVPVEWRQFPEENDYRNLVYYLQARFKSTWQQNLARHQRSLENTGICENCKLDSFACTCNLCPVKNESVSPTFVAESFTEKYGELKQSFRDHSVSFMETIAFCDTSFLNVTHMFTSSLMRKMFYARVLQWCGSVFLTLISQRNWIALCSILYAILFASSPSLAMVVLSWMYYIKLQRPTRYSLAVVALPTAFAVSDLSGYLTNHIAVCVFTPLLLLVCSFYFNVLVMRQRMIERYMSGYTYIREHHRVRWSLYLSVCGLTTLGLLGIISVFVSKYFVPEFRRDPSQPLPEEDPYRFSPPKTNSDSIARYFFKPKPAPKAVTANRTEAQQYVGKRMLNVQISTPNETISVMGTPIGSVVLIPFHALPKSGTFDMTISADKSKRTSSSSMKSVPLSQTIQLVNANGSPVDLALVSFSGMAVQPNLLRYFSVDRALPNRGPGLELFKKDDGTFEYEPVQLVSLNKVVSYDRDGEIYHAPYPYEVRAKERISQDGDCGALIFADGTNCVVGVHVAGERVKTNSWIAQKVTREMIERGMNDLAQRPTVFVAHPVPEAFKLKANMTGLEFETEPRHHVVEQIGMSSSPIEEIGHLYKDGRLYVDKATHHYFKNTNPALEDTFGPATSRPPVEPNGSAQINSTLKKLANPTFDCPIDLLEMAAGDYLDGEYAGVSFNSIIQDLKTEHGEDFFTVRSIEEACQGDGTGVIRGLNNASSAGFVYGGSKKKHLNMDVEGDPLEVREFQPHIISAIKTQEVEWRNGRGTFDPFKRCSKTNEILPWEKAAEKTRSFYGNDVVYNINATRGIMAAKHILRKNMAHSECFVGVVAQSKQWQKLQEFISRHDKYKNFVCGDFSGYDTQLPKSLLDMACAILLQMLKRGGMSRTDLEFVRGCLSSIASPTLIWEGHVLRMANGQPSGQPLTVELNSIMNSLLMRMAFYELARREDWDLSTINFREWVALATYGDDNLLGVDDKISFFNHTAIQGVFAEWGIKYTMADKDADSVPYQSIDQVSFLKRAFFKHPRLGMVAPIEKESITKKFYYYVRQSPLSFPEQFVDYFNGAAREAYLHGDEYYTWFCEQIKKLQQGSYAQSESFHIDWHCLIIPSLDEMYEMIAPSYEE